MRPSWAEEGIIDRFRHLNVTRGRDRRGNEIAAITILTWCSKLTSKTWAYWIERICLKNFKELGYFICFLKTQTKEWPKKWILAHFLEIYFWNFSPTIKQSSKKRVKENRWKSKSKSWYINFTPWPKTLLKVCCKHKSMVKSKFQIVCLYLTALEVF